MTQGLYKWSLTASANATADSSINWAEGMAPSAVNDSARAMMARIAEWRNDISGTITTGDTRELVGGTVAACRMRAQAPENVRRKKHRQIAGRDQLARSRGRGLERGDGAGTDADRRRDRSGRRALRPQGQHGRGAAGVAKRGLPGASVPVFAIQLFAGTELNRRPLQRLWPGQKSRIALKLFRMIRLPPPGGSVFAGVDCPPIARSVAAPSASKY